MPKRYTAKLGTFQLGKIPMGKVNLLKFEKKLFSAEARGHVGKISRPTANPFEGVYYMRHKRTSFLTVGGKETGKQKIVKRRLYKSSNPHHANIVVRQNIFKAGMLEWSNLTDEQKSEYNTRAKGKTLNGMNVFIKEYLQSN